MLFSDFEFLNFYGNSLVRLSYEPQRISLRVRLSRFGGKRQGISMAAHARIPTPGSEDRLTPDCTWV
jgi:hypothetical protein